MKHGFLACFGGDGVGAVIMSATVDVGMFDTTAGMVLGAWFLVC